MIDMSHTYSERFTYLTAIYPVPTTIMQRVDAGL